MLKRMLRFHLDSMGKMLSFMNNISQGWRGRESAVGPLRPAETDMLRELFTIDHLNFKELLAEGSSLECSLI